MPFFRESITSNWSRSLLFRPKQYLSPRSVDELVTIVQTAYQNKLRVRVIGSGHSFSPVAVCDDILINLDNVQGLISVDKDKEEASFFGGTKLYRIGPLLRGYGLSLVNMGDIDEQSLAGALQTGTHGTGTTLGCLSSQIKAMTLLLPHGELITCSQQENEELFTCARLALGMLGIVVSVTMQCTKAYILEDKRWPLALNQGLEESASLAERSRHYEFFWFPYTRKLSAKALNIVDKSYPRNRMRAYVNDNVIENALFQAMCSLGYHQTWLIKSLNHVAAELLPNAHYADDSYKVFPSIRNVRFSEMEFSVPQENGPACFYDIKRLIEEEQLRIFLPLEYRYVASDDIPLSPFHGRASVSISLHTYKNLDERRYFESAQRIFLRHGGRPHWGKIHFLSFVDVRKLYENLPRFAACRKHVDPFGIFMTPYLESLFSTACPPGRRYFSSQGPSQTL